VKKLDLTLDALSQAELGANPFGVSKGRQETPKYLKNAVNKNSEDPMSP
jgi:hypothetical protein